MADEPLAHFLSIHTYGTWLHGHASGSVDWAHNRFGELFAPPNPERLDAMRRRMKGDAVTFNTLQRRSVLDNCLETCRFRGWIVHALHIRTTHLHLVVSGVGDPDAAMTDIKAYATRGLRRRMLLESQRTWSRHGSTIFLWIDAAVTGAIDYTLNKQGVPLDPPPYVSDEFRHLLLPPDDNPSEPRP